MERLTNQIRANQIINFFQRSNFDRKKTLQHFSEQNVSKSTIKRHIKRFVESGTSEFKQIPGRPITVNTRANGKRVIGCLKRNPSKSVRAISQSLKVTKSSVQRIKVKNQVKTYTKRKVPKYIKDQEERAKKGCHWLYRKLVPSGGNFMIVMDDETYVPADPDQVHSKFWALSKRAYKDRTRDKVDLAGIRRIWPIITTKVANQHGKSLFFEFPEKLLRVQREGVLSV